MNPPAHGFHLMTTAPPHPTCCFQSLLMLMLMGSSTHFSLLWLSLSSLFLSLLTFLFSYRPFDGGRSLGSSAGGVVVDGDDLGLSEGEPGGEIQVLGGADSDENEMSDFVFRFRFQTFEEFSEINREILGSESLNSGSVSSSSSSPSPSLSNRYEFLPEKSTTHFVEEARIPSFTVDVLSSCSNYEIPAGNGDFSTDEFSGKISESEPVVEEIPESSANGEEAFSGKVSESEPVDKEEIPESSAIGEEEFSGKIPESEPVDKEEIPESSAIGEEEFFGKIPESEPVDKEEIPESSAIGEEEFFGKIPESEPVDKEKISESSSNGEEEFSGKISESEPIDDEEIPEKEKKHEFPTEKDIGDLDSDTDSTAWSWGFSQRNGTSSDGGFLSDTDFEDGSKLGEFEFNVGYEPDDEINEEPEKEPEKSPELDSEELNGLEAQWEHQELIEQLKMELKKVRATGLPTIFEEAESPKIMEELKPWKIEEKFQHGDLMEELHKFYRSYRERMRKLDILNYQKMYAMGVLQSKDPLKSFSSNSKSSSPSITSLLSHNLRPYRQKKSQVDPMKNFIREVHCDLEMVYVGQMCLSWEFIQWQYEKALDLWESEPHGLHHYNEVAGEFQQFQVLLQRFLENEAFEGPRVENYVKHRCVARNLLQVPVIREDKMRDRRKARRGRDHEDEAITSDMLIEILQESIRVIWQFIRADKDHNSATLKRPKKIQVELQDPADKQVLIEIQADLQKKERKLKEIVRSGHCILKKLQRNEEDEETEGDLCFFCEVDMKLVGRVLKMSRITTDQLVWCRNKLSRINFFNRKIRVEPSFFLFPC